MKQTLIILLALVGSFFLGFFFKSYLSNTSSSKSNHEIKSTEGDRVTGVAGIFFKSKDPGRLKKWYQEHLGMNPDEYGVRFVWEEVGNPNIEGSLQWTPFPENDPYFEPSSKDFMINYRVKNLDDLYPKLLKENVAVLDSIDTYPYGKFLHIMDEEGNKIELYEPNYDHK